MASRAATVMRAFSVARVSQKLASSMAGECGFRGAAERGLDMLRAFDRNITPRCELESRRLSAEAGVSSFN
jgi:hypothetical protein